MVRLLAMVDGCETASVAIYRFVPASPAESKTSTACCALFQDHGVFLVAVRDMIDTSTTAGRMMIGFVSVMAQ
jgi:hypothetical protein